MICASVCLLFDIPASPFFRWNHTQLCSERGEQVTTNCATATGGGFSEINVFRSLNGGPQSEVDTFYNGASLVTAKNEYDFGSATASRKTTISYDTTIGNGVVDRPSVVKVTDGSGNLASETDYTYDEDEVAGTLQPSGASQHVSVTCTASSGKCRGNVTTVKSCVTASAGVCSTYLTKTFTHYDTGQVYQATDVNGAQTTYTYGACGNSLLTNVSLPLSLSESYAWNCTGGVMTSSTDENSKVSYTNYTTDPYFWRPESAKDQLGNVNNLTYPSLVRTESSLLVATSSYVDLVRTLDTLGRPSLAQTRQAPPSGANFDTAYQAYDSDGRPYHSYMPCVATLGAGCSTPATTTSYDGANRPTKSQDGSNATVQTLTYNHNDTYIDVSAPTGENDKRRQLEYDGLGRLTSVCELTSAANGGITCGQTTTQTGYWTRYKYDTLGHMIGVCQNTTQPLSVDCVASPSTGQQTRTYAYDLLGRMTSETNPESGTTTYTYDSYPPGVCGGWKNEPGDLMLKSNANGTSECYVHDDGLDRLTTSGAGNVCRRFRYDSVANALQPQPTGFTGSNLKRRLVEAETDNCTMWPPTQATMITDEWFSYDADGHPTDMWESTPNSGGYYHSTASYWPHGMVKTLGLLNSSGTAQIPTQTYGVDTEGRPASVTASGQDPVAGVTYVTANGTGEPVGSLTQVTFGSLDSDTFQYDTNTGRMTQYSFNINGQSAIGKETWNTNGTLQKLVITDPFNSQDNQTCTYSYDDLARTNGTTCGSTWAQTFAYDPFGNISKSGSVAWQPMYNSQSNDGIPANNQYKSGWNGVSYDADGNLLNDTFNTYTWDGYGNLASANGAAIVYDAFGKMVENANGSNQFVYTPTGGPPLARMQGQTLNLGEVRLPGGALALYLSAGLIQIQPSGLARIGAPGLYPKPRCTSEYGLRSVR